MTTKPVETKTKSLTAEQKAILAKASIQDLLLAAAEAGVVRDAKSISSDPKLGEAAVQALHRHLDNPERFRREAKVVHKQQKDMAREIGNGLPLDCACFVFDFEMLNTTDERFNFVDAHIFQIGCVPLFPLNTHTEVEEDASFHVNIDPSINWTIVEPRLRRYVQDAWDCRGMDQCEAKARSLSKFPAVFREQWMPYLLRRAQKQHTRNILLIGFNSIASDLRGLQAEMQRHAEKWPTEFESVWLWDCAVFLRKRAQLKSKKWNLGLLYKTLTNKHMPNAHKALPDAQNLRELLQLTCDGHVGDDYVCEQIKSEAFGVVRLSSPADEAKTRLRGQHQALMKAQSMLTPDQLNALEIGDKDLKEGVIKGLGRKHAARLRTQHGCSLFRHLFDLYEADKHFVDTVLHRGLGSTEHSMAVETEKKLCELARHYSVPRDIQRRMADDETNQRFKDLHAEMLFSTSRITFLKEFKRLVESRPASAGPPRKPTKPEGKLVAALKTWLVV